MSKQFSGYTNPGLIIEVDVHYNHLGHVGVELQLWEWGIDLSFPLIVVYAYANEPWLHWQCCLSILTNISFEYNIILTNIYGTLILHKSKKL